MSDTQNNAERWVVRYRKSNGEIVRTAPQPTIEQAKEIATFHLLQGCKILDVEIV